MTSRYGAQPLPPKPKREGANAPTGLQDVGAVLQAVLA